MAKDEILAEDFAGAKRGGEVEDYAIEYNTDLNLTSLELTGDKKDNLVNLHWRTTDEQDMENFAVQVSQGTLDNFVDVTVVDAKNYLTQTYSHDYLMEEQGIYYFRIVARENTGKITTSNIL